MSEDSALADRLPASVVAVAVAIGLTLLAYGGGNVVVSVLAVALGMLGVEISPRRAVILSVLVLQLGFFVGVSLVYLRYRGLSLSDIGVEMPTLEGWIVLGAGFIGMVALWLGGSLASFYIAARFGIERQQQAVIEIAQQDPFIFLLIGLLSLLVVGPAEELLFRGVIQTRLRETFGVVVALTLATAIFALVHITGFLPGDLAGGLLGVGVLFLVGFVLAAAYEYTENLVVVAVMHGLFNFMQAALGFLGVVFGDSEVAVAVVRGVVTLVGA